MVVFKIDDVDFTDYVLPPLEIEPIVLLSSKSGRNARGNNRVDLVNRKDKITVNFKAFNHTEMQTFLAAIYDYVFNISYLDPHTDTLKTIQINRGDLKVSLLKAADQIKRYEEFKLSFIEM